MEAFLFIPSLLIHRFTGELHNDSSMAGTSMMLDIRTRTFSDEILKAIGVENKFNPMSEPGSLAGKVTEGAARETGIPRGTPVVLAGHDTQFALYGSGAGENEPFLSSGTWEILMVRSKGISTDPETQRQQVTNELDPVPGLYNSGVQWLASGVLEWVKKTFYKGELHLSSSELYKLMIDEASGIGSGCEGVTFNPDFLNNTGGISGIGLHTGRGHIYRAALEAMAANTKNALSVLEKSGHFKAASLIVGGGGARNALWNQIRANALKLPVKLIDVSEPTVLGAALFAFAGIGLFASPDEARKSVDYKAKMVFPEE
jgi:L-fuculokinase